MDTLAWYSLDQKDKTVDHGPVSLAAALEIAKKYYTDADKEYKSDAESFAGSMFGFMRGKDTFIQFSVCGAQSVLFWFEMPKNQNAKPGFFGRIFASVVQFESTLASWAEMEKQITDFYNYSPRQFLDNLKQAA